MFIAGLYKYNYTDKNPGEPDYPVSSMAEVLSHRNRDYYYQHNDRICFVSNNRPIFAADGTGCQKEWPGLTLVYSGQFFNLAAIRSRLGLSADPPCEIILKSAYKEWGERFIEYLDGEFAIAIFDKTASKLLLYRDRVGLKPLFYYANEGMIIFASEAKAILPGIKERTLQYASLHSAIVFGSVYSQEHLIRGVYELRAGNYLAINKGEQGIKIHKYWDREFNIIKRPFSYYKEQFKPLLEEAVRKRLPGKGIEAGVSSSGGFDSALILALVNELHSGPVSSYTAVAENDQSGEWKDSRIAAKYFNTTHHEIFISTEEALESLPKIIWHLGEFPIDCGIIGACIQTYFVGKLAKEKGCSCIFTGNGEEHNFDGNTQQRHLYKFWRNSSKVPGFIRDRILTLLPQRLRNRISYTWSTDEINNIEEKYILFNSIWKNESFLKDLYAESLKDKLGEYRAKYILSEYLKDCTARDYFNKLLYIDFKTWNSRRNLVVNERLLAASGAQLQIPFLDAGLVQFSSRMPVSTKHSFKDDKYFLKKIYRKTLPPAIFKKGKGVSLLRFDFFSGAPLDRVMYFVSRIKRREIFREDFIDDLLSCAAKGRMEKRERFFLIGLFTVELWFRIFIDNPGIKEENLTLDHLI